MSKIIDWTDVEAAAKDTAGNWQKFSCFAWSRGFNLEDADRWAIFYMSGKDGKITDAFTEFCRIKAKLDDYPILNEEDYSQREYEATLENYRSEMWAMEKELPEGWEAEVFSWFGDNGQDRHTENRDDQGGYAPKEAIVEALQDLGLLTGLDTYL